jgi:hypothetical protein
MLEAKITHKLNAEICLKEEKTDDISQISIILEPKISAIDTSMDVLEFLGYSDATFAEYIIICSK